MSVSRTPQRSHLFLMSFLLDIGAPARTFKNNRCFPLRRSQVFPGLAGLPPPARFFKVLPSSRLFQQKPFSFLHFRFSGRAKHFPARRVVSSGSFPAVFIPFSKNSSGLSVSWGVLFLGIPLNFPLAPNGFLLSLYLVPVLARFFLSVFYS